MQLFGQNMDRPYKGRNQKDSMITRSHLAEQLRDYQIRSQQNWASLSFFHPQARLLQGMMLPKLVYGYSCSLCY